LRHSILVHIFSRHCYRLLMVNVMSDQSQPLWAGLFPGQGSQSIGMLNELSQTEACVKDVFDRGEAVLGFDIWRMAQEGTTEEIGRTEVTQPLMLLAGVAVWQAWEGKQGIKPNFVAGHSLGEYTALVAAKAITLEDAVDVVKTRAKLMQDTVPTGTGAMSVVLGLDDDVVQRICLEVAPDGSIAPANYNAPGQVVVGGLKDLMPQFSEAAKAAGCKRVLPVAMSVPSHCALLKPAADQLAAKLDTLIIERPQMPVVNNVFAQPEQDPESIREALKKQIYNPVLWSRSIDVLAGNGCELFVEFGPKKVLTGLGKRICRQADHLGVETSDEITAAYKKLTASMAQSV